MSSRQLKKLQKQQELLRLQSLADEDGSSEEEIAPPKPRASAFAGFAALGDEDEADSATENLHEEGGMEGGLAEPAEPTPAPAKKSKKPKKKKKKAKKAAASPEQGAEGVEDGEDEIDRALKELSLAKATPSTAEQEAQCMYDAKLARLLSISFDHLKVINELRAMFGQETIDSVRNQEEAQTRDERRRTRRGGPQQVQMDMETFLKGRPGEKIPDVVLRKNPFMQGKEDWPKASAGGLKMEAVTDERVEPTEYRFCHDKAYGMQEVQFYSLVNMMDPMRIVHFVHANPYHVNSLIQTSRVAKQDHNAALAGDLCERALFTFGRVTLSSFRKKLERGLARLDFNRPENRQFWLAGYHYIKSLLQKGTYDTALEWTKLYLSLSPKDEYGLMNFTHVLAIYAYEAKWWIALCNSSYFNSNDYDLPMKEYHMQTCVLAKLQLDDKEGALKDLIKGMETLPWLYSAICSAVNIDTPRAIWGIHPPSDAANLYTELYIHMAKDIWKRDGADLLKQAGELATKVDVSSLPPTREVPLSIGRFIYLDNTPELMALVPSSMLHASPNFDYDPLPPPRDDNIFSNEWQSIPWRRDEPDMQNIRPRQMAELLRAAGIMDRPGLQGDGALPGELAETDEALEEELAAAAATVGGEGGFLATLARMLQPLWTRGGPEGPVDVPDSDALGEPNVWGQDTSDAGDESGSEDGNESNMPPLIPVEGGGTSTRDTHGEGDDEHESEHTD